MRTISQTITGQLIKLHRMHVFTTGLLLHATSDCLQLPGRQHDQEFRRQKKTIHSGKFGWHNADERFENSEYKSTGN